MGKIRNPQYRIVVADSRTKRDGRAIEYVGLYHPKEDPSRIEVDSARVQHWLSVGAQPSEPVIAILSKTGDWQKFKGLPPPAEPLKVAPARTDRKAAYEAEARAAAGLADTEPKAKKDAPRAAKATKSTRGKAEDAGAEATAPEATAPEATAPEATAPEATAPEAPAAAATEESTDAGADDTQG
jgi:small subunit ribosomal protein S16